MKRKPEKYNKFKKDYCEVCKEAGTSFNPLDIDHVKTFGSGGKNESWNLMTLCRRHHTEKGAKGISWMAENYPNYKEWLIENGWEVEGLRSKWVRYE